jgi:hypothetical protein
MAAALGPRCTPTRAGFLPRMAFVELPVETHPLVGLLGRGQFGNPAIFNRRGGAVQRNLQAVAKKQKDLVDVGLRR